MMLCVPNWIYPTISTDSISVMQFTHLKRSYIVECRKLSCSTKKLHRRLVYAPINNFNIKEFRFLSSSDRQCWSSLAMHAYDASPSHAPCPYCGVALLNIMKRLVAQAWALMRHVLSPNYLIPLRLVSTERKWAYQVGPMGRREVKGNDRIKTEPMNLRRASKVTLF